MVKKGLILLLLTTVLIMLTSCGLNYRYSLDENLHNQIECVWEEGELSYIVYQGEKYQFVGTTNFFSVDLDNSNKSYDDVMLSWNGYRYIWYIDEYYSYTAEAPLFIYNERLSWVYFREDYDYLTDLFVVENTNEEITYQGILGSKQNSFDFVEPIKILLKSKQCPRIKTYVKLVHVNNEWYISFPESEEVWIASDEFMKILCENGLI